MLHGDLVTRRLRGKHDVLVAGLYDASRVAAQIIPAMMADVAVVAFVVVAVVLHGDGPRLMTFLAGLAIGILAVLALRRSAASRSVRAWEARQAYQQCVLDALEGGAEILAAGVGQRYERRVADAARNARRSSWILGIESIVIGRLPVFAGIAVALLSVYVLTGAAPSQRTADWGLLAAMLAPFAGLASAAATLLETRGPVRAVNEILKQRVREHGTMLIERISRVALESVDVRYGEVHALRSVEATFGKGLCVLVGANGSGKSTLIHLLAGVIPADGGRISFDGASDSVDWASVRRRSSNLAQRPYVPIAASVRDFFAFLSDAQDEACARALKRIGFWETLHQKTPDDPLATPMEALSAGERQRIAIARALMRDADLFLLDEPDANLDQAARAKLYETLSELSKQAIVIVAAHTEDLTAVADRVLRLEHGKVTTAEQSQVSLIRVAASR